MDGEYKQVVHSIVHIYFSWFSRVHKLFGNLMVQSDLKISMQGGYNVGSVWLRGKKIQHL